MHNPQLHWKRCEKLMLTRARQLSITDYETRQGIILTREGSAGFQPGDFLAVDAEGEYPIRQATMKSYARETEPDGQGWALYRSTEIREAVQMPSAFPTDRGVTGEPLDYLLRGANKRTWPVAQSKFEREYRLIHTIYSIGYLNPTPLELLQDLVDNQGVIIVDIRLVARSRYRPDFSAKRLQNRFREAYTRLRELGNENYNRPDAGILLRDPGQGIPQLLRLLSQQDICLLCRCQHLTNCHTAVVLAEIQRIRPNIQFVRMVAETGKTTGKGELSHV